MMRRTLHLMMNRNLFFLASFLGLMIGCTPQSPRPVPTPYPPEYLPTVIALTARAMDDSVTATYVASIPTEIPTEIPEATPTPTQAPTFTPTSIPGHDLAAIQFVAPGPMSKLVSPINLRMNIIVGESKTLQVELFGEDGRLLSRSLKRNVPTSRDGIYQSFKIPFEIPGEAEVGRITVITFDKQNRIQALSSVHVLLLSSGANEINPSGNPSEPVGVITPKEAESVSGGVLNVRGDVWPFNLQPIIFELVDPNGKSIGLRIVTIDNINPQLFATTIPYKVDEETSARLVIRQDDDRMPGLFYLYSQEVALNP